MVLSVSRPATVSRTSSSSSVDLSSSTFNPVESRRTRKRISAAQLAQLELLYLRSSHPTRDERDALAKRIQMETKSVTIWFQNKRQTDRKVALHNATNSRNSTIVAVPSPPPDITLTIPTSPAYPLGPSVPLAKPGVGQRPSSDGTDRKHATMRAMSLKRAPSLAASITSTSTTSTTSTSKTRPSLDRVASRSELRFTDQAQVLSSTTTIKKTSSSAPVASTPAFPIPSKCNPPVSPSPAASPPLWTSMLSSPLAPSSPPPAEYIAYARTRRARTLDWACAAARLAGSDAGFGPTSTRDAAYLAHEYEEATAMTEDESEVITPNSSQDISMPWAGETGAHLAGKDTTRKETRVYVRDADAMDMSVDAHGWEEDEVHAALALCGLRG